MARIKTNTNYIASIVKILEVPRQKLLNNEILVTGFRASLPQKKGTKVINLVIWGRMSKKLFTDRLFDYIKPNDYVLIEGFLVLSNIENSKKKEIKIRVFKTYPILLSFRE